MNPKSLILSTFEEVTYFKAPCLPDTLLYLDVFEEIDDEAQLQEYVTALTNFLKLTPDDLRKAEPYAFAMFKDFEAAVDPSCLDVVISTAEEVWREIKFEGVNLMRGTDDEARIYVQLPIECSWDQEHGMQFVYLEGNMLTRVSEQDGWYHIRDTPGLPESEG